MDFLRKVFPFSFKSTEVNPFIVALVLYTVIGAVGGFVFDLLSKIPFVGTFVFSPIGFVVSLYTFLGIVLSILVFTKVIKD